MKKDRAAGLGTDVCISTTMDRVGFWLVAWSDIILDLARVWINTTIPQIGKVCPMYKCHQDVLQKRDTVILRLGSTSHAWKDKDEAITLSSLEEQQMSLSGALFKFWEAYELCLNRWQENALTQSAWLCCKTDCVFGTKTNIICKIPSAERVSHPSSCWVSGLYWKGFTRSWHVSDLWVDHWNLTSHS